MADSSIDDEIGSPEDVATVLSAIQNAQAYCRKAELMLMLAIQKAWGATGLYYTLKRNEELIREATERLVMAHSQALEDVKNSAIRKTST